MKIMELLTGNVGTTPSTLTTSSMMKPQNPQAQPQNSTVGSTKVASSMNPFSKEFWTTPAPQQAPSQPQKPAGSINMNQTTSNIQSLQRPIGGTPGNALDKINAGLQGKGL
jgi:hypothetical protein